jgi:predicted amidohydrolase YtcJ
MAFESTTPSGEDLFVVNAKVFSRADGDECESAMLIRAGRVVALGSESALEPHSSGSRKIDLEGRVVLPGLIDAHTHVEFSAMARYGWVDVRNCSTDEMLRRIAEALAKVDDDQDWIVAQATFSQELPSRDEIDQISDSVPVIVRESMHRYQVNTEALNRAGILNEVGYVPPGAVIHVDEQGAPTGLVEEAFHLFPIRERSDQDLEQIIRRELRDSFAKSGVTTIYEIPATRAGVRAYRSMAQQGTLPTRISLNPVVGPGLSPLLHEVSEWDPEAYGDDCDSDLIASGAIKIFIDGDNELALDIDRLSREPREWGALTRTLGQLVNELVWATRKQVQVWVHAIGDLAQDFALEAIARARVIAGPPILPTRLEHVANLQLKSSFVERLRELEVIPVPTANFLSTDDGNGLYAFRTLIDEGFSPPGNSDTGGSIAQAPNPWFGIALMMERRNAAGHSVAPEQRVSVMDGVRTYSDYSAQAAGLGHLIGKLEAGYFADFAVYRVDPRQLKPSEMKAVEADLTFVGGRMTWERNI